jgi:ribonuclease inhibitor
MKEIKMKRKILVNGKKIQDKSELHDYLIKQFNLPIYYGRNLDALWDVLSTSKNLKKITVIHASHLDRILGDYSKSLLSLFKELSDINNIELLIFKEGRENETK